MDKSPPFFFPSPFQDPAKLDQDQWTLEKGSEEEKLRASWGLRCLEEKEANLGASRGDYEMRQMEKTDFKTFRSVLGLASLLALTRV